MMPLRLLPAPPPWTEDALCAQTDPEAFYPEPGVTTRPAKAVCAECSVRSECLAYALANRERFGVWAGFSERERRKMLGQPEATIPCGVGDCARVFARPQGAARHRQFCLRASKAASCKPDLGERP